MEKLPIFNNRFSRENIIFRFWGHFMNPVDIVGERGVVKCPYFKEWGQNCPHGFMNVPFIILTGIRPFFSGKVLWINFKTLREP